MGYTKGLHEISDGCFAYLQPDGGWGWSNAGLLVGDGQSLLVDTLFDLKLTGEMLGAMRPHIRNAPIATLVNTHANGDHCYGNELVVGAEIIATEHAAREMTEVPPAMLAAMNQAPGEVGDMFRSFFGAFDFEGIESVLPTRTFTGSLSLEVGGRTVELVEVGPAHTFGDAIVYSPSDRAVYTGDILFNGGMPIVWAGPLSNWVAACDRILGLDIDHVIPGHGPLTDKSGVVAMRDELVRTDAEARRCHAEGMDPWQAAQEIYRSSRADMSERGRVAVNVEAVWRELDPAHRSPDVAELFKRMVTLEAS